VSSPARHGDSGIGIAVSVLSFANYGIFCVVGIVLARLLSPEEYGRYGSAVAFATLAATFATLGLEKQALRLLPAFALRGEWSAVRGYLVMSVIVCVGLGAAIGLVAGPGLDAIRPPPNARGAFTAVMVYLVPVTLFCMLVEVLTSFGKPLASTATYRLALPLCILAACGATAALDERDAVHAVHAWGIGWCAALALLVALVWRAMPLQLRAARAQARSGQWLVGGISYLSFSLIMTAFVQAPLIVLGLAHEDRAGIGVFTAAMQLAGFVTIIQTATTRVYAPKLSQLIEAGDTEGERRLMTGRNALLGAMSLAFVAGVALFGRELLSLFGAGYERGERTLLVLSAGNAVNTVLGFAPWWLQFKGRHTLVLVISGVGCAAAVAGMWWAASALHWEVVAWSYSIGLAATFIALHWSVIMTRRAQALAVTAPVRQPQGE
jgi:O-antigen/teichoic acid export membrane protein